MNFPEINSISCPNCASKNVKKAGVKRNLLQSFQKYFCQECEKTFTLQSQMKGKSYSIKTILNSISLYNEGYSQTRVADIIARRFKIRPSQKTISNWINEFGKTCTFCHFREQANRIFNREEMIESYEFMHSNLPYIFKVHKAKLVLLFEDEKYNNSFSNLQRLEQPVKEYLERIKSDKFPHHVFNQNKDAREQLESRRPLSRSSQTKFDVLPFLKQSKQNAANNLAGLALHLARSNRERHSAIQNFMLTNDSCSIAIEVPVYLTQDDIQYFKSKGFVLDFNNLHTPITGHIDILQIRNGMIHILDYKPEANKINAVNQLVIYALALASRTKLAVKDFKCAWFDENYYYEFFPLHAVYKKA